jgi:hypothetical protein
MSKIKKSVKEGSKIAGELLGDQLTKNAQNATDMSIEGMRLFQIKMQQIPNVGFEIAKGNLFEYIEAAKFNRNAATVGVPARAVVTDATGDSFAAADILIKVNGNTVKEIQAKFSQTNFNGRDTSAANSVFEQTGAKNKGWGQYNSMDRLIRKQENYNKDGSLLDEAKKISKARSESQGINAEYYKDVHEHLTDETHFDNVSSGGTTIEEVRVAYDRPDVYINQFERRAVISEMKASASNMAKAGFITTGVVSGIINMFEVYKDEKSLADALKDVGADSIKGGIRGGATGVISTVVRYNGIKAGSALLSDSMAATVMASGMIDGGVALYAYAKGELTAEQLRDEIINTTAKATTTIFFTKAATAILGKAVSPIVPMAIYTTASYVIACTREILQNAKLNIEESERLTVILQENTRLAQEYHEQFRAHITMCEESQRKMLEEFVDSFDYNLETGDNYDDALYSIVRFANQAGISLQHVDFEDFKNAMSSETIFELK